MLPRLRPRLNHATVVAYLALAVASLAFARSAQAAGDTLSTWGYNASGELGKGDNVDTTSLASLTAGNIAATGGMAKLLKENEFATQFHEGEKANIHIQLVGNRVILVVIFDSRSSLGLVRLRVKKASEELNHVFEALLKKVHQPGADSPFAEITDEDIDNLFND